MMKKNDPFFKMYQPICDPLINAKELKDFLFVIGLDIVAELELTHGIIHQSFCEGELYLIDRIKAKIEEMIQR